MPLPPRSALLSCSCQALSHIFESMCRVQLAASTSVSVRKGGVISQGIPSSHMSSSFQVAMDQV